jgi:TRAP-type transport system periplasmic protein
MRVALMCAVIAPLWTLIATASAQEPVVLRFNRWVPPTHHFHTQIMVPWAERVAKASDGRVRIEFTPASLGAPARQFELALTGVADITSGNQTYTPERFILSRALELPFLADSAEALSVAHWRVQERFLSKADEFKGTKLLTVFNNGPTQMFTTKKAIVSIDDLKGLKIRAPGGVPTEVAKAIGTVPVAAAITETYEMLSRGIVDGASLAPDSVRSFNMDKFLEFETQVPLGLYNSAFFVVMNQAKWDGLSPANQQAILAVSGERFAAQAGRVWDEQDKIANDQFSKSGMKIVRADPELTAALKQRLGFIDDEWVKLAAQKGVNGAEVLKFIREQVASYKSQ